MLGIAGAQAFERAGRNEAARANESIEALNKKKVIFTPLSPTRYSLPFLSFCVILRVPTNFSGNEIVSVRRINIRFVDGQVRHRLSASKFSSGIFFQIPSKYSMVWKTGQK